MSEMMRYPGFIPTRVRTLDTFTQPKWLNKLLKEIIKKEVSWGERHRVLAPRSLNSDWENLMIVL